MAELLASVDITTVWDEVDDRERHVLIEDLVDAVYVYPDHLRVVACGAPRLNVLLSEVGLAAEPEKISGVGGATRTPSYARQTRVCHDPSRRS